MKEAPLERTDHGLKPGGPGWFVTNLADCAWKKNARFGQASDFQGEGSFTQNGWHVHVLQPGQPNCYYHAEGSQEDFLVLQGQALLLVEGRERSLKAWDVVHCPPDTAHVFVGAGDAPCVILMVGPKDPDASILYPRDQVALKHGAGVEEETPEPRVAYADCPRSEPMSSPWKDLVG